MATHANAAAHPRSRTPLVIDISRLGRRPGSMLTLCETVAGPSRIGLELIAIDQGAPLELDLRIESVSEGVLVTGRVSAPTLVARKVKAPVLLIVPPTTSAPFSLATGTGSPVIIDSST